MPLVQHPTGNYFFLPGIAPYSCGVVASPGFEVVNVRLQQPVPYRAGFDRILEVLAAMGRPQSSLCAVSLRSPRPFSFQGFAEFNSEYTEILKRWGVFVGGVNPVARTNVAPVVGPPAEPALYGFAFTRPCAANQPATFVVAGAGELPEGVLARDGIVALGDSTVDGVRRKAKFVMDLMENRLLGLGARWPSVNTLNVYTVHPLSTLMADLILERVGSTAVHGVHWYYSQPPIEEIEFEMDVRGTRTELVF